MNTSSNGYVLGFAIVVCVAVSTALAVTATGLRDVQKAAEEFDRQKNVMLVAGLIEPGDPRPIAELKAVYAQRIREQVLDLQTGRLDESIRPEAVGQMTDPNAKLRYRVIAVAQDEQGKAGGFVLPIRAKGLWGPMFGYISLESDANTVRGITFYQHKETPGLGGEVDNEQWKQQWEGKKVLADNGELVGITVKKGRVDPGVPREAKHYVDGLSGATITSNGVTRGIEAELEAYRPYLSQFWTRKNDK